MTTESAELVELERFVAESTSFQLSVRRSKVQAVAQQRRLTARIAPRMAEADEWRARAARAADQDLAQAASLAEQQWRRSAAAHERRAAEHAAGIGQVDDALRRLEHHLEAMTERRDEARRSQSPQPCLSVWEPRPGTAGPEGARKAFEELEATAEAQAAQAAPDERAEQTAAWRAEVRRIYDRVAQRIVASGADDCGEDG